MERTMIFDDLDGGSEGVESHTIAVDDRVYTIDLGPENLQSLEGALAPFLAVARLRQSPVSAKQKARNDAEQLRQQREWANSHGYAVSKYGKIPLEVVAAYDRLAGTGHAPKAKPGSRTLFSAS